jgi:small-conductance mechanosensitive channel
MDLIPIIGKVIGAATILLITFFLSQGSKKTNVRNKDANGALRLPAFYLYLGTFCLLIFFSYIGYLFIEFSYLLLILSLFMFLIFGLLGCILLLSYFNHRLYFDETHISGKNWRNQAFEASWSDIKSMSFNRTSGNLILQTPMQKIRINIHLIGLIEFLDQLELQTGHTAAKLNIPFL